jgi:hypothetical protein
MVDRAQIEELHRQVRARLRSVARTGGPVLAELAREVLAGNVSLRDAVARPGYAEAVAERIDRSMRELDGHAEPAPEVEPEPAPRRAAPRDDEEFFADPLRHNRVTAKPAGDAPRRKTRRKPNRT